MRWKHFVLSSWVKKDSWSCRNFLSWNREIIFSVNAGNAGNLRNIYTYNIDTGELKKSPHLSNHSSLVRVADIDNDGYKEIIVSNHSSGNGLVSNYNHRSDYSTWFYLLDHSPLITLYIINRQENIGASTKIMGRKDVGKFTKRCILIPLSKVCDRTVSMCLFYFACHI